MTKTDSFKTGSLRWFCRRFLLLLISPIQEWKKASEEEISESSLFKSYTIRLSLLSPILMAPFVFMPNFYLGTAVGIVSCFFIFGINVALTHLYSVVFEAIAAGLGGTASRIQALKLSTYSLSPWFFMFGMFPILRETALVGLLWSFALFVIGSNHLVTIDPAKRWRFIALSAFLCLVLLFLSNLFFAGILGMIVGPQAPVK